jgi:hypothetical protein
MEMLIKGQPEELNGKPIISEKEPLSNAPEAYIGRVIIEFWGEISEEYEEPAFAWSVDNPEQPNEEWLRLLLNGLKGATRHIEDVYRSQQKDAAVQPNQQKGPAARPNVLPNNVDKATRRGSASRRLIRKVDK